MDNDDASDVYAAVRRLEPENDHDNYDAWREREACMINAMNAYSDALHELPTPPAAPDSAEAGRSVQAYLERVTHTVLLEAREMLVDANLSDYHEPWTNLPRQADDRGEIHQHLLVAAGEWVDDDAASDDSRHKPADDKSFGFQLLIASYSMTANVYNYTVLSDDAEGVFASVGHRHAEKDLRYVQNNWFRSAHGSPQYRSLGYVGDGLNCLAAIAAITRSGRSSPLLTAVADPRRRSLGSWRAPTDVSGLNAGQEAALRGLRRNIEAISGPPGTGKSTMIAAIAREALPSGSCAVVSAVQNRAIESIAEKLARTADALPFVVHGNEKRLSPVSLKWTLHAQALREPRYLAFLRVQRAAKGFCAAIEKQLRVYAYRTFRNVAAVYYTEDGELVKPTPDGRGMAAMSAHGKRREKRLCATLYDEDVVVDDVLAHPGFKDEWELIAQREKLPRFCPTWGMVRRHFIAWHCSGGGDGLKKMVDACCQARYPAAVRLRDFLRGVCKDCEVRASTELFEAKERVCERSRVLVCTCAATGGLVRYVVPEDGDIPPINALASRCSTLVVDEAGTCPDTCIVPILPYQAVGGTFERLVMVGDSKQLPPFSRLRGNAAPVALLERVHHAVGSSMLTAQYRMFDELCRTISALYYDGRLENGKTDKAGELDMVLCSGTCENNDKTHSYRNNIEADKAVELAAERSRAGGTVAILSFYKGQVWRIKELINEQHDTLPSVEVMTVDSAQGQEHDHVILSCVVRGDGRSFLEDQRRMCVALSRAKRSLTVICHPSLPQRINALATVHTVVSGGIVAVGTPVTSGYPIGRARGRFGRGRGRGRDHGKGRGGGR